MAISDKAQIRFQSASPEKQTGVCCYNKKRRNTVANPLSDMEELEGNLPTLSTPYPPDTKDGDNTPEWHKDGKGDTTMVDSLSSSPMPVSCSEGNLLQNRRISHRLSKEHPEQSIKPKAVLRPSHLPIHPKPMAHLITLKLLPAFQPL